MNPFLEEAPTQQQDLISPVPQDVTQAVAAPVVQSTEVNPFLPSPKQQTSTGYTGVGEVSITDKLAFASQIGFADTYRGVKQLFGVDEEEMAAEQAKLNSYLRDEEDGGSVLAAYTAGLFGDPVGWVIPGMKAKNAYSAMKAGVVAGGIVGATGYNDEELGLTRAEQTLIGMTGGGVLSPALYKFQTTLWPTIKASYDKGLDTVAKSERATKIKDYLSSQKDKPVPAKLGRWFIDNYGLPENYVKAKKNQRIDHEKYAAKFTDVVKKHTELTPEENALLYRVLTGEETKIPANLAAITKESRQLVDNMGQELVDLGMLDAKVYQTNKGKYLYRSYEKTAQPQVKKLVRDAKKIKIFGGELMRRGKTEKVGIDELDTYKEAGYRQVGSVNRQKGIVSVNRDWTPEERTKMGEVVSSAYGLAKTGKLMTNDIASFKFYDTVSKDKDVVWSPISKDERLLGAPEGYAQVPTTKVGGTPKYGNLAGKYVPQNVYDDIKFTDTFKAWKGSGLGKLQHNMQTWWKRTKTSLNPVVHMNNVMSNVVLYDLVDANYKHIGPAARELMSRTGDFTKANELGVFQADLMKQELSTLEKDVFKVYMHSPTPEANTILNQAWNKTKSLGKYLKHTHLDALYGTEDNIFRLGLFKDRLAKGDTENEAAQFARKYMLDYEIHAPGVKMMRETGWPFISYIYRAAPIVAEAAVKRPWKVAKWGLVLNGANQLGVDVAEGDIDKERKLQKELNQGFEVLGMPGANTMIKVPRTDKSQYLDVSRWVPAGDVLDTSSQGFGIPGVPAPLQPSGGALGGLAKTITGFDTYTQRKAPGVGSGVLKDEISGRAGLFFSEFFPGVHQIKKLDAAFSNTDGKAHPSKDDYTKGEALLGAIGIKVKEFNTPKMTSRVGFKYKNRMQSLTAKTRKLTADFYGGRIEKEDYRADIKRIEMELRKIAIEANEALN